MLLRLEPDIHHGFCAGRKKRRWEWIGYVFLAFFCSVQSLSHEAHIMTVRPQLTQNSPTPALEEPHRGITASNSAVYAPFLEKQTVVASSAMHA